MRERGASVNAIAIAQNVTWQYAKAVLEYADSGVLPNYLISRGQRKKKRKRQTERAGERPKPKYIEHSDLVRHLKDEKRMSFKTITEHLNDDLSISISYETVVRAYDYSHPELAKSAVEDGKEIDRGRASIIGEDRYVQIRQLLSETPGLTNQQIADRVGCGSSTVHRERQRLKRQAI